MAAKINCGLLSLTCENIIISMVAKHHMIMVITIIVALYINFCASKLYYIFDFIIIFVLCCNIMNVHITV